MHVCMTRKYFNSSSELIDALIEAHNEAESWQTKRQILSLFANDFSCTELESMIPSLSKWRIDQARSHATPTGNASQSQKRLYIQEESRIVKVDHFWTTFHELNCSRMLPLELKRQNLTLVSASSSQLS